MRGWPVHRPTHAPATAFRTNSNSAPPLCVVPKLLACERIPLRHRSNLQRKKQHRHSGIFRVADLGPGTMPRGKYPESPAPAGSHALISRTPTPGGMLHANLGPPRPPPRNFQLSRGQHTPDTGATSKEKTKTNPPRAISPEVARRRMTTPVVNTRPTPEQPSRKKQHRHSGHPARRQP